MTATNFFSGNPDLLEVFDKVIPWERVVGVVEGPGADVAGTVSTWREVLDLAGRYIATEIAPRAAGADERADDREPPWPRRARPRIAFGARRFRRSGAAVHGHDDDRRDARPRRSRDAGAARHRVELAGGAHLSLRHRRAEGALSASAREGRDHGRGRDDRAAGRIGRRPSHDDRDAAPGRLLDPSGA